MSFVCFLLWSVCSEFCLHFLRIFIYYLYIMYYLYILDATPVLDMLLCRYFLSVCDFVRSFPKECLLKHFNSNEVYLISLFFVNQGFDIMSKKCLPTQRMQRFSSRNFCLTKFFQLIFVYGRRKEIFHPDILVF